MAAQDVPTAVRCNRCERDVALVDEHNRCERCVRDLYARACALFEIMEYVDGALECGLTADEVLEAVDMQITGRPGALAGVKRTEDGDWQVDPPSSFLAEDDDVTAPNRIKDARTFGNGITLEELAAKLGEEPATVAGWERGAPIPDEAVERLSALFGLSPAWLLRDGV